MRRLNLRAPLVRIAAVTAAVTLAGASLVSPAQAASPSPKNYTITSTMFGIHAFGSKPQVPSGSLRFNLWPTWLQVEPSKGHYNWKLFDHDMFQAQAYGYSDIMYVFAGTPQWAAGPLKYPTKVLTSPPMGPGSAAAPKSMSDFKSFVTAVVKRYGNRIKYYQAWNEATSPQFFQGTPKQMAQMTKIVHDVVKKYGKGAKVVSASVQTHRLDYYTPFAPKYFKALKKMHWPVDIAAGHFYTPGCATVKIPGRRTMSAADARVMQIQMFNKDLAKNKFPKKKQKWDTEANYCVSGGMVPANGRIQGTAAATLIARNYLDSWREGLRRSYWYLWSTHTEPFAGIQLFPGLPTITYFSTIRNWTVGTKYKGCKEKGKLVTCAFKKGKTSTIAFTHRGKATVKFKGKKTVCPATGAACITKKKKVRVGTLPMKIG